MIRGHMGGTREHSASISPPPADAAAPECTGCEDRPGLSVSVPLAVNGPPDVVTTTVHKQIPEFLTDLRRGWTGLRDMAADIL